MSQSMYQILIHQPAHWLYIAAVCVLALYVLLASGCRIWKLNPGNHKFGWRLMYLFFTAYPAFLMGYVLTYEISDELLTVLAIGLGGKALNLFITHAQWAHNNVAAIAKCDYKSQASPPAFVDAQYDRHHAAQVNAQAEERWQRKTPTTRGQQ